jgi:hypothetical protein
MLFKSHKNEQSWFSILWILIRGKEQHCCSGWGYENSQSNPTREINKILSTEMDMLRKSARKSRMERIKNEHIKEIMEVKGNRHQIEEKTTMVWPIKRMPEERRKRGCTRKTWMEGIQAAMITRNLEPDQWRNREEWCMVSGRWRQLL